MNQCLLASDLEHLLPKILIQKTGLRSLVYMGVTVICMLVVARVRAEKRVEFLQAMDALDKAEGMQAACGNFTISPSAHEPNLFQLSFEWGNDEDFEHCLDSEEFSVFLGAVRVLCEEATFASDSHSKKWVRVPGIQLEPLRVKAAPEKSKTLEVTEGKSKAVGTNGED